MLNSLTLNKYNSKYFSKETLHAGVTRISNNNMNVWATINMSKR